MKQRYLIAIILCAACEKTPAPAPLEDVPLPGEWTLVAVNDSPVPFSWSSAFCIRREQMRIDEQGRYSRDQSKSDYTCQDPETSATLTGQWAVATADYQFTQDGTRCTQPPAVAKLAGNTLVVDWRAESPSRGNPCYAYTWTFKYQKN
jgi:hypothetical protein